VRPSIEPISVADLAQDIVQKYTLVADRKTLRLELTGPGELPLVRADIGLIERVLENLLANAIEHTPAAGLIQVSLRQDKDRVRVDVADSGCGIPPDKLARLFEPGFQVRGAGGSRRHAGLGLAIAKRILDLHDNRLTVASDVGIGTRFSFSLAVAH
jgi:signal transduction histidine kinase